METKGRGKDLSDRLRRRLTTGESVYFSAGKQYQTKDTPAGRWVVKVRRIERGRLTKFPVKSFTRPEDAVAYAESTRPENRKTSGVGQVPATAGAKVATVRELFEFCRTHTWKTLSPKRRELKESRWANHLEPIWGSWSLASVRRSAAQEWLSEKESELENGKGLAQLNQCRTDMIGMFKTAIRMEFFEFSNPFEQLSFSAPPARVRVTIESKHFADLLLTLSWLAGELILDSSLSLPDGIPLSEFAVKSLARLADVPSTVVSWCSERGYREHVAHYLRDRLTQIAREDQRTGRPPTRYFARFRRSSRSARGLIASRPLLLQCLLNALRCAKNMPLHEFQPLRADLLTFMTSPSKNSNTTRIDQI